ncbi:hypothetical protein [Actinosynnema mirum]|uniref:Uncharacterized protein n=1 Tax=Actinosynnema mirum (strain ATCC 29888 / DSM 43827 / JCM 3225 / NBRC 14064 / NCIMB 13271 / NRRL B-12336 / IMRU 3971 / 101) TaxID=446462 RepID=C6WC66_ACTMD|nr:hypothetical protein [Actinosynnema mirum]ACU39454.1 hypothetical protein Amir_5638 [Actinosynnema mirum DSM 43827]
MRQLWRCLLADTVTGRIIGTAPYEGTPGWQYGVNLGGQVQITVPARKVDRLPADLHAMFEPWRVTLAMVYGRFVVQAGPIMTYRWDDDAGALTVGAGGLWAVLNRRVLKSSHQGSITEAEADVVLAGLSLGTIAKRLVQHAETSDAYGGLPIAYPDDVTGAHERTYYGYDLAMVGERLTQLTQVDQGPDVELRPRFATAPGFLEWEMRIGAPMLGVSMPQQSVRYGAGLRRLDVDGDASEQASDVRTPGQGMERALPVGRATDSTLQQVGHPALHSVDRGHTSVTETPTLDGHAAATIALRGRPVETWTGIMRADGALPGSERRGVGLGAFAAGDVLQIGVQRHGWIPTGQYPRRAITVSSTGSPDEIQVQFAPALGVT